MAQNNTFDRTFEVIMNIDGNALFDPADIFTKCQCKELDCFHAREDCHQKTVTLIPTDRSSENVALKVASFKEQVKHFVQRLSTQGSHCAKCMVKTKLN